jgi:adenylate kinase
MTLVTSAPKLAILGRQGAGKGTQGLRLAEHLGLDHISTGDLLRQAVADRTTLGRRVETYLQRGDLVPDPVMVAVVDRRLREPATQRRGFLLDGFPRTREQAAALFKLRGPGALDAAVLLDIPTEVARQRLDRRRVCPSCGFTQTAPHGESRLACPVCGGTAVRRSDDTAEAIERRLAAYDRQAEPLLDWFAERGLLVRVDGLGAPDGVFERLNAALRPVLWGTGQAVG